jgi:uncharacterized protein
MIQQSGKNTVLITGASGGIGEELARVFARERYNLVLLARSEGKLRNLAEELHTKYKIHADILVADLTNADAPSQISNELAQRATAIDVLVNNAGFATYGSFVELDPEGEMNMLQVNIVALTHLTRLFLPGMVARKRGGVLNVASTAAFLPGPLMAVYYATKAFVLSFSEALNEELRGTGVSVTALCPGPTTTGFQSRANMEASKLVQAPNLMDAKTVAEAGYAGFVKGKTIVIPGLMNRMLTFMPRLLPRSIVPGFVKQAQERAH